MIFKSFYARLSLLFLLLILAIGSISLAIAFRSSEHLFDEVEQLLNREYASSIALELQPLVKDGFSKDGIKSAIHYMMVLNPMVEIYLLDDAGKILAYFTHPEEELLRHSIDLEPVERYLRHHEWAPVPGDDPRTIDERKPFSASRLQMGDEGGYVYVILRGQSFDRSLAVLRSNYYLKSGFITFLVALIITAGLGLSLFFLLTRRLRVLSNGVRTFQGGDLDHRIQVKGGDELSDLGTAFNEMAVSINDAMNRIRDAEKQRSELIANISHDLRSPLTSIRAYLETLKDKEDELSLSERQEFLEISLRNLSGYQQLVEELFELAKLESRQISLQKSIFNPAELVQDILMKLRPLAEQKFISLKWEPDMTVSGINGDIAMIERALSNILENAINHTPPKGNVAITVKQAENEFIFTIEDDGPGIASEDLPHVFERFFRADRSRNRSIPGTGLGLAISKEIAELHDGSIIAGQSSLGGALFSVIIPQKPSV